MNEILDLAAADECTGDSELNFIGYGAKRDFGMYFPKGYLPYIENDNNVLLFELIEEHRQVEIEYYETFGGHFIRGSTSTQVRCL